MPGGTSRAGKHGCAARSARNAARRRRYLGVIRLPTIHRRVRRGLARAGIAIAVLAATVAGLLLGLRVAGPQTYATPLGTIDVEVRPALQGRLDAYVPLADWGLRARAFDAPLEVHGAVRSLERDNVLRAATGEREIVAETRAALDDAARKALIRAGLFAFGGAVAAALVAVLALLALGRRRRRTVAAAFGAIVLTAAGLMAGSAFAARETFDPTALQRPSFYARGAELLQLLSAATKTQKRAERYVATAENGVRSFSQLLADGGLSAEGFLPETGSEERMILASDLHNNTLAVRSLEALADQGEPVFFVGDFGHQGIEGEIRLVASSLAGLGERVVAVSGNHDSRALMRRLAAEGITVLTGRGRLRPDGSVDRQPVIDVRGMKVAGIADPLEWQGPNPDDPERVFSFSERENGDAELEAAGERAVRWFDGLAERPDILLIHNYAIAQRLARALHARGRQPPLVVLTGHDHKQWVERHGDIVIADAGTAGAGGVFGVGSQEIGLGELHFDSDRLLRSVDLIKAQPLSGGAQAERVIAERCEDEAEECRLTG